MSGLKLRADLRRHWNKGVWPRGMSSGGGGAPAMGFGGLGDNPETILNSPDPVGLYVKALQVLFGMPTEMQTGLWNYETHKAMLAFLGDLYGVEDVPRFPGWMQDPGFTGFFVIEMFFGGFEMSGAFERMRPFYAALGLPSTSMRDAIQSFTSRENAGRMRQVLDRVNRYVIGCEGGRAYGSPTVKTEGIVAAAGAFVGSVAAVLLVG